MLKADAYADSSGVDGIVLKKRSVRLCLRIFTTNKDIFKKFGGNSDRKDNPSAQRSSIESITVYDPVG